MQVKLIIQLKIKKKIKIKIKIKKLGLPYVIT